MDVSNVQMVSVKFNGIVILNPYSAMTKQEALVFAAWIVTLADDNDEFEKILTAVHNI